jgi:hypothetical protein
VGNLPPWRVVCCRVYEYGEHFSLDTLLILVVVVLACVSLTGCLLLLLLLVIALWLVACSMVHGGVCCFVAHMLNIGSMTLESIYDMSSACHISSPAHPSFFAQRSCRFSQGSRVKIKVLFRGVTFSTKIKTYFFIIATICEKSFILLLLTY